MEHNSDDKNADGTEEAARKESRLTSSYGEGELFDKITDNEEAANDESPSPDKLNACDNS